MNAILGREAYHWFRFAERCESDGRYAGAIWWYGVAEYFAGRARNRNLSRRARARIAILADQGYKYSNGA